MLEELPIPKSIRGTSNSASNIPVKINGNVCLVTTINTSSATLSQLSGGVYTCSKIATYNLGPDSDSSTPSASNNLMNAYFNKAKHAFRFNMIIPDPDSGSSASSSSSGTGSIFSQNPKRSQFVRELVSLLSEKK